MAPEKGTGWHRHEAEFHIVIMLKGWARFMYEDQETLVQAGDCVHQRPGIRHFLFDYSPDMEYLEIVVPGGLQVDRRRAGVRRCRRPTGLERLTPVGNASRTPLRARRSPRAPASRPAIHSCIAGSAMMRLQ